MNLKLECQVCHRKFEILWGVNPVPNESNIDFLIIGCKCPFCKANHKLVIDFGPVNDRKKKSPETSIMYEPKPDYIG